MFGLFPPFFLFFLTHIISLFANGSLWAPDTSAALWKTNIFIFFADKHTKIPCSNFEQYFSFFLLFIQFEKKDKDRSHTLSPISPASPGGPCGPSSPCEQKKKRKGKAYDGVQWLPDRT